MRTSKSISEVIFDAANVILLCLLSIVTLYPFLYVLFASISTPAEFVQHRGILLWPKGFSLDSYRMVFENPNIIRSYLNTIFYVAVGTTLNILMTALGAYGLSRKNVMWKSTIMMLIVMTMFFDGGLIPKYLLMKNIGLLDTYWALIIPSAMTTWNLIIMRTAFQGVPDALEESARIDGANDWTILFRIIIPLSLPVIAVMVLFYGVWHWNKWFDALIYLRDRNLFPLQLILREILIQNDTNSMMTSVGGGDRMPVGETIKYATIMVATLPILFLYPFLQKYFVKGVMIGAIKE
ncbi:binding-protein-dependent transport systems inner membrane component [Paenibacillus vortex V453]|jgi:putative aldouronate transport system permease protein|uniref:Sugar ABC transporter permease n=2 Tax=Paenibacillus TaxID=44249 RepID=A0A163LQM4_9BACL|nr:MULTISPECIES: carbohydrate ABC transporter permease [Paenibacillus]ANA82262.1 sugar ABC transporter permease [Paenibacillus glucanolyticus]AVV59000.1 carbohydrate ABC transporter permease [Paenibacillus glucanolyticus]AWP28167.1 sugar ABC transporter permease [Paenibacillus sp. Cedars]EFU41207.1 binding-protein-dependent transport systems inner membrane component [Paenibacillus vortex V453]ETT41687.1 binding-protein-dependent transport systems inner membrane component [Paenibacillus sp. FSL